MTAADPANQRFQAGLLASAKRDAPPPEALNRELERLGLATLAAAGAIVAVSGSTAPAAVGGAGAGGATAAKAGVAVWLGSTVAKIGLATAIVVTSTSGYLALRKPAPGPQAVNRNSTAPATATATKMATKGETVEVAVAPSRTEPRTSTAPAVAATAATAFTARAAESRPTRASTERATTRDHARETAASASPEAPVAPPLESATPTLGAEVSLVDRARSLARSSPTAALAILDEHARTFPSGALRDEAAVVRVEALLAAGRRSEAERHAAPFVRDRAGTPIARRMTALLGS